MEVSSVVFSFVPIILQVLRPEVHRRAGRILGPGVRLRAGCDCEFLDWPQKMYQVLDN